MPEFKPHSDLQLDHESMGLEARASKEDHQSLRLWLRLLSCSTEIETEIRRRLRSQFDMSLARFDYLAQLHRHPQGLSMRVLSRYLMVTGGNITGLTDELEREGLVSREAAVEDRRSYCIKLTTRGRKAFEQVASIHEAWIVEFFSEMKVLERQQLHGLLGKLRMTLAKSLAGTEPASAPKPAAKAAEPRGSKKPGARAKSAA